MEITQKSYAQMEICYFEFVQNVHLIDALKLWRDRKGYKEITKRQRHPDINDKKDMYSFAALAINQLAKATCDSPQKMILYRGMNVETSFWELGRISFCNFTTCTPSRAAALNYSIGRNLPVLLEFHIDKGFPIGIVSPVIEDAYEETYEYLREPEDYKDIKEDGLWKFSDTWEIILANHISWTVFDVQVENKDILDDEEPTVILKCKAN